MGKNFMGYVLIADRKSFSGFYMITRSQLIADDRKLSQKIEHGSTFCDLLRSSAITIAGSQTIAEVCFHMIADDRRTFYDLRSRSAFVCDDMETSLKSIHSCNFSAANENKVDSLHMGAESCLRQSKRRRLLTLKFGFRSRNRHAKKN